MKSKNFRISDNEWDKFKEICRANNTDVSKALREFILKANTAVQEVIGAKKYYNAQRAMVVTNNYFTKSAKELANINDVKLWDRDLLIKKINSM